MALLPGVTLRPWHDFALIPRELAKAQLQAGRRDFTVNPSRVCVYIYIYYIYAQPRPLHANGESSDKILDSRIWALHRILVYVYTFQLMTEDHAKILDSCF